MKEPNGKKRLLVCAGSFADAQPALRIAEALVGSELGDIAGVLVEELQDVESLPAQARCVVTASGAVCVAPPPEERRLQMESDAKAFRDRLIQLANQATANWRFEREKGDPIGQFISTRRDWDLLVIGHRIIGRQTGCVVTIKPQDADESRTSGLSQSLAKVLRANVLEIEFRESVGELLSTINKTRATAIIIDTVSGPIRDKDQIRKLVDAARCPVLIVGASETQDRQD